MFVCNTFHDHGRDRLSFVFEDLGERQVENIARPVPVYRVRDLGIAAKSLSAPAVPVLPLPDKPSIAVLPFASTCTVATRSCLGRFLMAVSRKRAGLRGADREQQIQ